jgi:hypothetical protein
VFGSKEKVTIVTPIVGRPHLEIQPPQLKE